MVSDNFIIFLIGSFMIFLTCVTFASIIVESIDYSSVTTIGEESVPCIDKEGNPFEDEMCTKDITCSKLGLNADYKCSEIKSKGGNK